MNMHSRQLLRLTPQQLRAFDATARLLSVTRAAQELHVTQPTVSVQLRELSSTIGQPLFEMAGRRIKLTQYGELLRETVAELIGCWDRFDSRIAAVAGLMSGRLRIAAVTTAEYFVPDLIGPFAAAHPGVDIDLAIENRDRVVARLQRNADDLAVMMLPPDDLPLNYSPFMDNPLVVIARSSHPLVGRKVALERLANESWLMREAGSGTRRVAEEHFVAKRFSPRIAMSLGSNEAIKHSVASGLGVAVLSRLAVQAASANHKTPVVADRRLAILDVRGFPIKRRWLVVWRKDIPLSAAAKRFVAYLQEA
jgi:LysR family transcriptional regulator, low CO2-responsive transcriptional regulator